MCWKFQDIENQIFLVHSWQQLFWFVFYFSVFITFSPNHSVSSDACSLVRLLNTRFTITTGNYIILFVAFFVPHIFFLCIIVDLIFAKEYPSVTGQNVINEYRPWYLCWCWCNLHSSHFVIPLLEMARIFSRFCFHSPWLFLFMNDEIRMRMSIKYHSPKICY